MPPVTKWTPTSGNGEMSLGSEQDLTTVLGVELITVSGNLIATSDSIFTQIPTSIWKEDDSL